MSRGQLHAVNVLLIAAMLAVVVWLWVMVGRLHDAQANVERYTRMCHGVAFALDDAARAADHGDREATRNVLAWPVVLDACAGEDVDTSDLGECYLRGDTSCAARELRAIAARIPAR